ncbi:MAG: ABC transporter substrate-binding protein [Chitinophagales bacterium]|nr:ABC transporter substrate-binding protein [Chitinophagales bacterium]
MRIISLVPSITLLLFDLGLENNIVGRTKFCIHPKEQVKSIPTIGGTKNIDMQKIKTLQPTIIFATKEENEKEPIDALKKDFNVIIFDVKNIEDNYKMIAKIGKLTNTEEKAKEIIEETKQNFEELKKSIFKFSNFQINILYLIWRKPYMTIGKDTFIHSMIETIGLKNMFAHQTRYPIINNLQTSYFEKCQLVLLSSEPYPFTQMHIAEIQQQLPKAKIILVDGEYFSWYGSKMKDAPAYFQQLITTINEQIV